MVVTGTRHVALLVETSNAYARGLLVGVKKYVEEHPHWSLYLAEHSRHETDFSWLEGWHGDGVLARIEKRIPLAAGLGGGSSDAAASLRALPSLWGVELGDDRLQRIAAGLGADVPYFLLGGTALGVERGDVLFPLIDWPASWVVLLLPDFGVSTSDAYRWFDRQRADVTAAALRGNDLEAPVVARHPEIGELVEALRHSGASYGAMSGSGSAVFGLFGDRESAESAAGRLKDSTRRAFVTRTLRRAEHRRLARPV